jgi:hypothetical protein
MKYAVKHAMKHAVKRLVVAGVVLGLGVALPTRAADWVMIGGSEEGRPDSAFTPIAFTQLVAESTPFAQPVSGLTSEPLAGFNGKLASFNQVSAVNLDVRRLRLGARGTAPLTQGAVTYFVAVEAGHNATTRGVNVNLIDASLSVHALPGVRVRVGQFKLPTMDETLESNPLTADFTSFSLLVSQLMLEQPVTDGAFSRPAFANRDLGVMLFNSHLLPASVPIVGDHVELSWALMGSQGFVGGVDVDDGKDLTARASASWLFPSQKRTSPWRQEISVFAWAQLGTRTVDVEGETTVAERNRRGVGLHTRAFGIRGRFEAVAAGGMLFLGASPAFAGQPVSIDPEGTAWGFAADVGVEHLGPFEVDARLEQVVRGDVETPAGRVFRNVVVGAQYKFTEQAKLMFNYSFRHIEAGAGSPADVRTILDSIGDLASLQLSVAL